MLARLRGLLHGGSGNELARGLFDLFDYEAVRDAILFLVMGIDAADGVMTINDEGRLQVAWNTPASMDFFREVEKTLRNLTERRSPGLDGNLFLNPTWTTRKHLITVHPLGGCPMGDDPATGVVDADGRVFHYPNLYVVDGSIVPTAIGPNPSKTIGALAERVAEKMIADGL